jgi:hypothetical protein
MSMTDDHGVKRVYVELGCVKTWKGVEGVLSAWVDSSV